MKKKGRKIKISKKIELNIFFEKLIGGANKTDNSIALALYAVAISIRGLWSPNEVINAEIGGTIELFCNKCDCYTKHRIFDKEGVVLIKCEGDKDCKSIFSLEIQQD